jgi:OFA family oxalate/formate antiporter-like MFS transporter
MSNEKVMNRWWVVVGAILVQLSLGAIYAWSVFTPYLKGTSSDGVTDFGFTATQTQWIFSVCIVVFAIAMIFAGRWQDKAGPRKVALTGGIILGIGYILAKFFGTTFLGQVICIGVIGGAGIGLAYVCPIAASVKWFPDKKGLITGFAVAGFGFGAMIWVKLGGGWGHLIDNYGVLNTFLIYGIIFIVSISLGSIVLVNPPEGYKPEGWEPPATTNAAPSGGEDFTPSETMKTRQCWMLWLMYAFSATAGLMVIGNIKLFGISSLEANNFVGDASAVAGTAMVIFSLLNGLGRITWGTISDKIGRPRSIFLMTLLQSIMMVALVWMGGTMATLYIVAGLIGFNFGGNFSLFPTATADFFGPKNLGTNYAVIFTAYGVSGVVGPLLGGRVFDLTGSYLWAFIPAAALCFIAAMVSLVTKSPHHNKAA